MVMSARSENHENDDFEEIWTVKAKSDQPNVTQNNSTELLGYSKFEIYCKDAPPDPKTDIFLEFLQRSLRWAPSVAGGNCGKAPSVARGDCKDATSMLDWWGMPGRVRSSIGAP